MSSKELLPVPISAALEKSIGSFSPSMADFLTQIHLPTENILSPVEERRKVITALSEAIGVLPIEDRQKAAYLTKFAVAVAVGLFDGALNYLWNETIAALRRLVARFDLEYFFSVAEQINSRNRRLTTREDLDHVEDHDLLEACRRIGLISDVNYKRLEHVNFMRNHASAAHPNENEIDGFEILGWLTTCLRYAITAVPNYSVVKIKQLLANIRTQTIPKDDFAIIGVDVQKLSQERLDDLSWTFFGMYVDPKQSSTTKTNISGLAGYVWGASTEDRKYEIGARYGLFRKNAEVQKKEAADEFLHLVGGQSYKDEDSLAGELIEKLGILKSVHYGIDNFYNEYPHAKTLHSSLPPSGIVPRSARSLWVKVIATCYIGNGYGYREGVDEGALPYYRQYIDAFSEAEIVECLRLMSDPEFTATFDRPKVDRRVRRLAMRLQAKTDNTHILRALNLIINAPARTLDGIFGTVDFKDAMKYVPNR